MPPPTEQKERTAEAAALTEGLDRLDTAPVRPPTTGVNARRRVARLRGAAGAPALSALVLLLLWQGAWGLGLSATLPSPAARAPSQGDARGGGAPGAGGGPRPRRAAGGGGGIEN
ncbi:hypothetical protein ACFWEP_34385, partial [Streptomyces sp. NPDC060198]